MLRNPVSSRGLTASTGRPAEGAGEGAGSGDAGEGAGAGGTEEVGVKGAGF